MLTLHGPHQVAQNSTTYRFLPSRMLAGLPLTHSLMVKALAASPNFAAVTEFKLKPAITAPRRKVLSFIKSITFI